jgi:hypothetical protein
VKIYFVIYVHKMIGLVGITMLHYLNIGVCDNMLIVLQDLNTHNVIHLFQASIKCMNLLQMLGFFD